MLRLAVILTAFLNLSGAARNEEAIPVIELRGEGKPMSSAQIRHLDELANGGPLNIKVDRKWRPAECGHEAAAFDWIEFHYKMYIEDGRKIYASYDKDPVRIQLGTAMTIPGLDEGLIGSCATEVLRINVPWRMAQKEERGSVFKHLPAEEHWMRFDVEVLSITPFSLAEQFKALDKDADGKISQADLVAVVEGMATGYGRKWPNVDVDNVLAAKYFIRYFDINGDGSVDASEFVAIAERDEKNRKKSKATSASFLLPGFERILDFNNDGVLSQQEIDDAASLIEKGPARVANERSEL